MLAAALAHMLMLKLKLKHLWISAAVPYAATTFNLTRGASFWNAVTPFTPSAFSRSFNIETAAPCAEQKLRNRRLTNTHTRCRRPFGCIVQFFTMPPTTFYTILEILHSQTSFIA